ncbi:hypothetical protein WJX72_012110 [[Myrmecia] bisecta]|uniref:Uncharacterized protein n=1 Tax=[Myrmecia] bisecta TaxID=41462 RepID=A0AAW1QBH3_9CHLO
MLCSPCLRSVQGGRTDVKLQNLTERQRGALLCRRQDKHSSKIAQQAGLKLTQTNGATLQFRSSRVGNKKLVCSNNIREVLADHPQLMSLLADIVDVPSQPHGRLGTVRGTAAQPAAGQPALAVMPASNVSGQGSDSAPLAPGHADALEVPVQSVPMTLEAAQAVTAQARGRTRASRLKAAAAPVSLAALKAAEQQGRLGTYTVDQLGSFLVQATGNPSSALGNKETVVAAVRDHLAAVAAGEASQLLLLDVSRQQSSAAQGVNPSTSDLLAHATIEEPAHVVAELDLQDRVCIIRKMSWETNDKLIAEVLLPKGLLAPNVYPGTQLAHNAVRTRLQLPDPGQFSFSREGHPIFATLSHGGGDRYISGCVRLDPVLFRSELLTGKLKSALQDAIGSAGEGQLNICTVFHAAERQADKQNIKNGRDRRQRNARGASEEEEEAEAASSADGGSNSELDLDATFADDAGSADEEEEPDLHQAGVAEGDAAVGLLGMAEQVSVQPGQGAAGTPTKQLRRGNRDRTKGQLAWCKLIN